MGVAFALYHPAPTAFRAIRAPPRLLAPQRGEGGEGGEGGGGRGGRGGLPRGAEVPACLRGREGWAEAERMGGACEGEEEEEDAIEDPG